ncbi:D-alanyl-D-alanine carboxypeptidase [Streptomyces sp. LX-29]|uniref:D-alanyl-D-alanine carboxypeptidase family protein n=1 Tax=Streptomyces sp. LX-29 TaxID=2900152 RepID=UPI00240DAEEB|nr:D-alanyl-D-alanine carboxypeptidase [Streptomyces sp. LX-29]WFB07820.1 D-alanyl-D-alanine carboxypeptidase [Streptomyces sp. LX-29]
MTSFKEVSVAGESPDTSEQQKSSGETTQGERDPRLAVARERGAASRATGAADGAAGTGAADAGDDATGAGDGAAEAGEPPVDRATAVLRTLRTDEDATTRDRSPAGHGSPAGGSGGAAEASGKAAADDVREREADVTERAAQSDGKPDGAGDDVEPLPMRPAGRGGDAAKAAPEATSRDASASSDRAGVSATVEGGDARLRAAVAAWVSSANEPADADTAGSASDADSGAAARDADAPEGKTAAGRAGTADRAENAKDSAAPRAGAGSAAPGDADAAEGTDRGADEADTKDAEKASARRVDQPTAFFGALRQKSPDSAADATADRAGASAGGGEQAATSRSAAASAPASSGSPASSGGVDRATAVFGTLRARGADADAEADAVKSADKKESVSAGGVTDRKGAGTDAPGSAGVGAGTAIGRPADQPTTAFRAPQAPAAGAGRGAEAGKAAEAGRAAGAAAPAGAGTAAGTGAPAAPSGKPSTFVPLRSADDPAPARQAPAKPATARSAEAKPDTAATAAAPAKPTAPAKPAAPAKPGADKNAPAPLPDFERTKQQPLPPTPGAGAPAPLDLLAQLTNTPPPPETPTRTIVRRIKIWTPLVILLAIIFVTVQAMRPLPTPQLEIAKDSAAFTFQGTPFAMPWPEEGQAAAEVQGAGMVGTFGEQKPVPIASVTKVMTAYVILRDHPLKADKPGPKIKVDAQAGDESDATDESRVAVSAGQEYTQRQMLEMLMIPSGNNIARLLARWDAGSEEAFVKKMNDTAKKLGMKNTVYTDPSGLSATTKSTAVDQLKLAKEVMKDRTFRQVVRTENIRIPGLNDPVTKDRIFNNNSLVTTEPGTAGIKTGSSSAAGGALMWAAYKTVGGKDQLILGVTLDQRNHNSKDPNAHLAVALAKVQKQISATRGALVADTLVKKGQVVGYVEDGLGGRTPVVATKDLKGVGWAGHKVRFSLAAGGRSLPHTAKAGTVVGDLTAGGGPGSASVPVALKSDLSEPSFGTKLTRIG